MAGSILILDAPHENFPAAKLIELVQPGFPGVPFRVAPHQGDPGALDDVVAMWGFAHDFTESIVAGAKQLRWIHSFTTGVDGIMKLKALRKDITVTSSRGLHGPQMSELTFLHMLALSRDYQRIAQNQRESRWERWSQSPIVGKTVVILGVGAIAEALAKRCKAFDLEVIGVSSSPRPLPNFDRVMARSELKAAAALADFLVVIVPLSPETQNIVDASVIVAMKPSAFLINVARGGVCDEKAILDAVREKRIAGAGLDVFVERPLPAEHPFWLTPGILITPHIGGTSTRYLEQSVPLVEGNLKCFLAGKMDSMANIIPH